MHISNVLALCALFVLATAIPAAADVKGPKGEKCESTESNVKHDISGKHYTCDKCIYMGCKDPGAAGTKLQCGKVTYWANCVEDQPAKPAKPAKPTKP